MEQKTLSEKLSHIWYYYKYFIVFFGTIALALIFVVRDCSIKKQPDLILDIYKTFPAHEKRADLENSINQLIEDVNNDGTVKTTVSPLLDYSQLKMALVSHKAELIIIDETTLVDLAPYGALLPLDSYLQDKEALAEQFPSISFSKDEDKATIYAIPIAKLELFHKAAPGIEELYISLLNPGSSSGKKHKMARQKNAAAFMKQITKHL